jgi:hypothetical protein
MNTVFGKYVYIYIYKILLYLSIEVCGLSSRFYVIDEHRACDR